MTTHLTDVTNDDNETETLHIPKVEVEDIPMEEVSEEEETTQADAHAPPVEYGRGIRTRKKSIPYEPVMTDKLYRT